MALTHRVLGQAAPASQTETDLYTVGAGTTTVVSSLVVANRAGSAAWFRASVAPDGIATEDKLYFAYDMGVEGNESVPLAYGITMDENDKIRIWASNAHLSFNLFGQENG